MNQKLSLGNDSLQPIQQPLEVIENLILNIRGKQVMLDRDLARLYGVETRSLNQAVKRNIERFPEDFMFQLAKEEVINLKSQIVISSLENIETEVDMFGYGGRRTLPYAFTENGIAMLSSVLRSETAIHVNIQIMRAFVAMRHTLLNNNQLFNRIENIEHHQLLMIERQDKTESQIETLFQALSKYELPKENVFYNNQLFDAHILMSQLIESAQKRIVVIDNYVDASVLTLLSKRKQEVSAEIYTYKISEQFSLDLEKHNAQYPAVEVYVSNKSHDRFLIIDNTVYHVGASIKDLGKKLCAVIQMSSITPEEIIGKVQTTHS